MFKLLNNLKILTRAILSSLLFITSLVYSNYKIVVSDEVKVAFAELEMKGNEYFGPVAEILHDAAFLSGALADGNQGDVQQAIAKLDKGMSDLGDLHEKIGGDLQFTEEGLSSRGRENLSYDNVLSSWQGLKANPTQKGVSEFVGLVKGMAAHAGDTSNLVLDPDLDSYYLMDVIVLAMPQAVSRVGDVTAFALPLLKNPLNIGKKEEIQFHTFSTLMTESDIARIKADFETSYKEDEKYYGVVDGYEQKTRALLDDYVAKNTALVDMVRGFSEGQLAKPEDFKTAAQAAASSAQALWDASRENLDKMLHARVESVKSHELETLGYSVGMVLIAILGFMIVIQSILKPLNTLTNQMLDVANGKLDQEIPYTDSKSEIGNIARSLQIFKDNSLEKIRLEEAAKEAERQAEIDKRTMMNNLADNFEQGVGSMISSIASASTQLSHTAEHMSKIANDTNIQSVEIASASEQASHNVQSVASAAEEMAATVQEISRQIAMSNNIVHEAMDKATAADKSSKELVEISKSVGAIATLIEDIAGQINLLALNATIESARSGEAGKGFAVVANEVKNLATQTAKATEQIRQQLEAVQVTATGVAGSLGEVKEAIARVSEGSAAIAAAVEEQSAATQEIVSNMNTATRGVDQINGGIFSIKSGTESTTTATQEVLDAARMLSNQAERMGQEVKNFLDGVKAA